MLHVWNIACMEHLGIGYEPHSHKIDQHIGYQHILTTLTSINHMSHPFLQGTKNKKRPPSRRQWRCNPDPNRHQIDPSEWENQ